jgi:BirA family biotin operon repressor/biotin-[acetyl-CoA-carboxylase] ligase
LAVITELAEVGSTNDWLRHHAGALPDGWWVRADRQTAGRGRMGRHWETASGNLAASCLIRPRAGEGNAAELGFVAAVALFETVAALVQRARLQLKWPNDLLLDGAKLSGILLEREGDFVVLGIGVNLAHAPTFADRPTLSLASVGVTIAARDFLERLAVAFETEREAWGAGGFAPVRERWLARAHPLGTPLAVSDASERVAGRFGGIGPSGELRLDTEGGPRIFHAGDVWLRRDTA